ncbi:hypothetical protein HF086_005367 [Spodoptera exigua]|uniref:Endonuclease/exonuclease/phosphatase domain-containing protein n=1 Tax=Spodoptera exigua TaxID=7107 RepID=A0A922M8J9_SPOEX|nr:hypothetical protein HF086_005367 [Spodoptera exigua]
MAHEIINRFSEKVNAVESKVTKLENAASQVTVLQAHIDRISRDLQDRDQWARANNAEIKGIPQKSNENLYDIAQKIGSLCNVTVRKEDINYIARIPTPDVRSNWMSSAEDLWVTIKYKSNDRNYNQLNLCVVYLCHEHLGNSYDSQLRNLTNSLSSIIKENPDETFVLMGDFNMPNVEWLGDSNCLQPCGIAGESQTFFL